MVPGFNHNIKHKGQVFHVQTEDSGPKNPHIITHLFVGGNILSSKKTTYLELVGQPDYEKTVRTMMEEQHKEMLRNLIKGKYDAADTSGAYHLDGPAPLNTDPSVNSPATAAMAGNAAYKGRPGDSNKGSDGNHAGASEPSSPPPGPPAVAPGPAPAATVSSPGLAAADSSPVAASADKQETIFGEDLISEKSLDEVILSYLAEDLADLD